MNLFEIVSGTLENMNGNEYFNVRDLASNQPAFAVYNPNGSFDHLKDSTGEFITGQNVMSINAEIVTSDEGNLFNGDLYPVDANMVAQILMATAIGTSKDPVIPFDGKRTAKDIKAIEETKNTSKVAAGVTARSIRRSGVTVVNMEKLIDFISGLDATLTSEQVLAAVKADATAKAYVA
jgi:hypothetical protein